MGGEDAQNEFQESMNEGSSVLIGEKSFRTAISRFKSISKGVTTSTNQEGHSPREPEPNENQ